MPARSPASTPATNDIRQTIAVGSGPTGIAWGAGSLWVTNSLDGTVSRINASVDRVVQRIPVGSGAVAVTFGAGSIWVGNPADRTVTRIDAARGHVLDGTVSRVDPSTNGVTAAIQVGGGPTAVAAGSPVVWVTQETGDSVVGIDPKQNQVTRRITVGNGQRGIALVGDRMWLAVGAFVGAHRGGTLTVRQPAQELDSIDPALAYSVVSWPIVIMTNDGLTTFKRVGGTDGNQVVPDLATALPAPTDNGKTYTFQLRRGIRYSTGALVRPEDLRAALERVFALRSPGAEIYGGIVGADACLRRPASCDLTRGISTDDRTNTIAFHLRAADAEFLEKLALPFADAVPVGTGTRFLPTRPLPATGPYTIKSYRPRRLLVLVRNPRFREWSKAAQPAGYPDQIVLHLGGSGDAAVTAVEHGTADFAQPSYNAGVPAHRLGEVETRYPGQLHVTPISATIFLFLNTRLAPFDNLDVRRAVNYAIDRRAIVALKGGAAYAQPTCQVLPPNFPGYQPYCPYTLHPSRSGRWSAPDLPRALRLIDASHTKGMRVTVWSTVGPPFQDEGRYVRALLARLGFRVVLKEVPASDYLASVSAGKRPQACLLDWVADYPAASKFINSQLSCAAFRRGRDNPAQFCDPAIDAMIRTALRRQALDPEAANPLWARIDHLIVDRAPWAPLVTPKSVDLVSRRVGNYQYNPQFFTLLDQLWVK